MGTPEKYTAMRKRVLEIVAVHPGIGTIELTQMLKDEGNDYNAARGVVSSMGQQGRFFRARNQSPTKEAGIYRCWSARPHGIQLDETRVRRKGGKHKPRQADLSLGDVVIPTGKTFTPLPLAQQPILTQQLVQGMTHPPHKPATMTVNIEMPNGSLAVFTLDEVVRLYEQVRRVLEAFNRVSL